MTPLQTAVGAIAAALSLAATIGALHTRRSGVLRTTSHTDHPDRPDRPDRPETSGIALSRTGPTIVHFTAVWCGPCAAVRRVANQVCAEVPQVAHIEIDLDANPVAARELSVLSLPTTFIFDAEGRQRYRAAGVPKAADLRAALLPLLA